MSRFSVGSPLLVLALNLSSIFAVPVNAAPRYNSTQQYFLELVREYRGGSAMIDGLEQEVSSILEKADKAYAGNVAYAAYRSYYSAGGSVAIEQIRNINRLKTTAALCIASTNDGAQLRGGNAEAAAVIQGLQIALQVTPANCNSRNGK